jgi:general secretion pathway protein K
MSGAISNALADRRGAALLLVLWLGALFVVILSAFAFAMRTELDAARNVKDEVEAYALAQAGIARALVELSEVATRPSPRPFTPWRSGEVAFGRGAYEVVVTDEESKLHLGGGVAEPLGRLLRNTGVTEPDAVATIVDAVMDWLDADDFHRLNGAEEEYYGLLPEPYRPRNGPFEALEELLLVKGMTRDIFYGNVSDPQRLAELGRTPPAERHFRPGEYLGIRRFLTILGTSSVNPMTASADVRAALALPDLDGAVPAPALASATYAIDALGRVEASAVTYRIVATVAVENVLSQPRLRVVAWQERPE